MVRIIEETMKMISLFIAASLLLIACGSANEDTPASSCDVENSLPLPEQPSRRFLLKAKAGNFRRMEQTETLVKNALGPTAGIERVAEGLLLIKSKESRTAAELAGSVDPSLYEYIEPDYTVTYALESNDKLLASQWAHRVVQSAGAWDISRGNSGVIVAVVDSGIDPSHPDLEGNLWTNPGEIAGNGIDDDQNGLADDIHGWNFAANTPAILADDTGSFHGTHVAGTIGAVGNNNIGISGHAQEVRLMTIKFLKSTGAGSSADAIRGIDYAIANGARIISNSWGSRNYSRALYEAIGRAKEAGVLFVAAAGNHGTSNDQTPFYPANYEHDNVISVAASTSADKLASFSNYGYKLVHVAAPGHNIHSTKNEGKYQTMSGTSMATPLVSGVLATMVAARPDLSYLQIKGALLMTVDEVAAMKDKVMWNGRVNALAALTLVSGLSPNWVPPVSPEHSTTCL